MSKTDTPRADVYSRITNKILADLAQGVRPWMRPWNAEHAAGRITRPLRHNCRRSQSSGLVLADRADSGSD